MDQQTFKIPFKKINFIHCRMDSDTKKRLIQKAKNASLDLTRFIEKVANEDIVFIDNNLKTLFNVIRFVPKI
jgi:hypothetical protein